MKSVHRDVQVLMQEELVARDSEGRFCVPFARIHAEFDMARAAA